MQKYLQTQEEGGGENTQRRINIMSMLGTGVG